MTVIPGVAYSSIDLNCTTFQIIVAVVQITNTLQPRSTAIAVIPGGNGCKDECLNNSTINLIHFCMYLSPSPGVIALGSR